MSNFAGFSLITPARIAGAEKTGNRQVRPAKTKILVPNSTL
jgi:hypothetical protein